MIDTLIISSDAESKSISGSNWSNILLARAFVAYFFHVKFL